jgi:hypothetical protein
VNVNNVSTVDEKLLCNIFDGLRTNVNLVRLSAANCDVNDFAGAALNLALEKNQESIFDNLNFNFGRKLL